MPKRAFAKKGSDPFSLSQPEPLAGQARFNLSVWNDYEDIFFDIAISHQKHQGSHHKYYWVGSEIKNIAIQNWVC